MSPDLTDGAGSADPGIDQLFRILTGGPAEGELSGEQDALAMFRANVSPLASPRPVNGATVPFKPILDGAIPAGRRDTEPKRPVRHPFRAPARWGLRLGIAGVIAIGGGTAAAAYAAVLPTPVQNIAHSVFGFVGVPNAHHQHHTGSSRARAHHSGAPGSLSSSAPGRRGHPSHGAKPSPSAHASATPSTSPTASPSPSPSSVTGPAVLSASAASAEHRGRHRAGHQWPAHQVGNRCGGRDRHVDRAACRSPVLAHRRNRTDKFGRKRGYHRSVTGPERGVPAANTGRRPQRRRAGHGHPASPDCARSAAPSCGTC